MIPQIKICGVKKAEHVAAAVRAGANAVGLNFVPPSSRYVGGVKEAAALMNACPDSGIAWAGVFVNPEFDELRAIFAALDFQIVQLHGSESPEFVRRVKARVPHAKVWKAFRVNSKSDLMRIAEYDCDGILLDAKVQGAHGGTGQTFDWSVLEGFERGTPLILSGGLNAQNAPGAIRQVRPDWVDVASGVEVVPGEKCVEKIAAFIAAVRNASGNEERAG